MKKKHFRHLNVFSFIKDSLLLEVDEWRERELARLFDRKDPTVATLTKEGIEAARAKEKAKKRKRSIRLAIALIVILLLLCCVGAFLLLRGTGIEGKMPHAHSLNVSTKAPTCTEGGYTEEFCTDDGCDYRLRIEERAPLGHTERITDGKAPSYTETGYTDRVDCSVCGTVLQESVTIPMLTHSFAVKEIVAPTCTALGYTLYACTDAGCGENYRDDYVKETGHTPDTPMRENEIAADCTVDGSYDELTYCAACPTLLSKKTVTVPSAHRARAVLYKGGDCTVGTYYEVPGCLSCGEQFARNDFTISPRSLHTMENGACATCGMPESSEGLQYEYITGTNEVRVTGIGSCTEKDLVIGIIDGYTVSEVSGLTKTSIETVTLSDGVRTIAPFAFELCSSLTSVTMGEGMRTIDVRAFGFCTALCECSLGKNVEVIGTHAFWGCSALTGTFSIPASVSSLADDAFMATSLSAFAVASDNFAYTSIDGNLYTKDGKTLMQYAKGRTETRFVVPDGVERILLGALSSETLKEIVIPKSVVYIESNATTSSVLETVIFEEPNGWMTIFGDPIDPSDLADPKTATDILRGPNDGFKRKVG